tara:strand:+ start:114 stop:935 length:822 start_codon:yes stop_codon:yes gene_type:complete
MNIYPKEMLNEIFNNEIFLLEYNQYSKENNKLINFKQFIDSIQLNKKYFRLEMNNKQGYKKKYKNQNIGEDTLSIKEINSLLNKLTDKNILSIRKKIKSKLLHKEYLTELIIESILNKCIIHTPYISLYLELIQYLYSYNKNINDIIYNLTNKIYESIVNKKIEGESDYLIMCEKNKKLDKLIGHSILITELEKKKIIKDKIHSTLDNFINILSECKEDEEKYKCVQCLYNIFKSYYSKSILPEGYNQKLNLLIESEQSMKIKFKMMDIVERK